MPDGSHDPYQHFNIQRRNLIIVSVVAIIFVLGEFNLEKISFLGNEATINEPNIIYWMFYSFFIYFLWRYYSASRGISGFSTFLRSSRTWIERYCQIKIKNELSDKYDDVAFRSSPDLHERTWAHISFRYCYNADKQKFHGELQYKDEVSSFHKEIFHLRIWSYVHAFFNSTDFSTYIFPYIIACIAFFYVSVDLCPTILERFPFYFLQAHCEPAA